MKWYTDFMKKLSRKLFSPIMTFIGVQLAWLMVVGFWIYWFMGQHQALRQLAEKYGAELVQGGEDWVILAEGLLLLMAILVGTYVIFLYWKRQAALNKEQKNFFSQVTHELKSPLASIQLHLETIQRHHPTPEKLETFVATMLQDTERLNGLISNLLTANRLEQKDVALSMERTDLGELIRQYISEQRVKLPEGSALDLQLEPKVMVKLERESIETVLRNLLENAALYADKPLKISIHLRTEGGRKAHLLFRDNGRGIDRRDLKKVFRMFYRVRSLTELKPGSGLGLFIVRNIIRRHRGKVRLESRGAGTGTSFHIYLPICL